MTTRTEMQSLRKADRHRTRRSGPKPFCGVDGEGGDIGLLPVLNHEYLLLRAGEFALETGSPLGTFECLAFLADLPKDRIYVSFFFDYDVTMMLRELPLDRLIRILDTDCRRIPGKPCSSFPVDVGPYQIDYMPHKEFRVRRRIGPRKYAPWTVIHDTGAFFQSTFVSALRKWFIDEPEILPVIEKIAEGKDERNKFGAVTEYEREYNILEIKMLERLMEKFRDVCSSLDMRPSKWQGPGNLVSAVFKRVKLPGNKDIELFDSMPQLMQMANSAYYGGRFEVSTFGQIEGPVYQYDINSAYANTYRTLPCLIHGEWKRVRPGDFGLPGSIRLLDVEFDHSGGGFHWGTLPIRTKKGTLIFPSKGRGRYWSTELDIAQKYEVKLKSFGGWEYVNKCGCQWFDFVYELYDERIRLGKDVQGYPIKILLASLYGKLAQSVGCAPYSNPIWAGLIVSAVRSQLIDAALSRGNGGRDVLMLATDGLFCTENRGLDIGGSLGQWELTEHTDMFIVQSGVYFLPSNDERPKNKFTKTRGVPQSKVIEHEEEFRQVWNTYLDSGHLGSVKISLRNFIGLRLAIARNAPHTAGQWIETEKTVSFDWSSKRAGQKRIGGSVSTGMIEGSSELTSEPYDRIIGGIRAAERLVFADQPDWGDVL